MADRNLSTTTYAMLGYLAIRPWSAYELAKQMGRTFHHFWPRAESGIYREFKRLTEAGLAVASEEVVGRRARTRYEITPAGAAALRTWLADPRSNGFLESEGLVRVLFSDHSTKDSLLDLLDVMVADTSARAAQMTQVAHRYLVGEGDFPRRAHINVMIVRFLVDFDEMVQHWAEWSREFIEEWPDTHERDADTDTLDRLREAALPRPRA